MSHPVSSPPTPESVLSAASLRRRLPPPELRLRGAVRGTVEVLRDRAGVPHVYAGSTTDLYFGLGLAMAQDRLWQIDRLRRRALGRQAEILGPDFVASDRIHLTVGIDRIADAEASRLDGPVRALVEAFVGGINRWIEACAGGAGGGSRGHTLPVEFELLGYEPEPFTVRDVLAILRGMWWSLNGRLEQIVAAEAARLLPDEALRAAYLTPEAPEARIVSEGGPWRGAAERPLAPLESPLHGSGDATGSNNWAVAAGRAASGHALLCSDPHQGFWLPSSWYEYAVHGPEDDAAGAGHPGVPGIWFGSNGRIAWGVTNNAASTRDLYVEEPHPDDPGLYRDGQQWRRFEERQVTIPVRGEAPRQVRLRATARGPIVNDVLPSVEEGGDRPLALRWVGQEHLDDLRALVAIGRAKDWPSFRTALRDWSVPVFNFGYADATGIAGYQCAGRIPVRGRVARGYRRADEPQDRWQGYVPFDALPRQENPARGYVASANNRVAPDDYPYPLHGAWAAGHRAVRLHQALEGDRKLDRGDAVALQNDVKSCRAERLCPPLLDRLAAAQAAVAQDIAAQAAAAQAAAAGGAGAPAASAGGGAQGGDADVELLRRVLGSWDYHYTLDSAAPVLFEAFMQAWQARVAAERFPARLAPLVTANGSAAAQLIEGEGLAWFAGGPPALRTALLEAARQAVARVRRLLGDDPAGWRWGAVHTAHWRHALSGPETARAFDVGPVAVDGGADTVRNTGSSPAFESTSGAEYRLVVDFASPDRLWAVQNVGNSGQPGSPHYADQLPAWVAGEYHVVHLRREHVEADRESQTLVVPE